MTFLILKSKKYYFYRTIETMTSTLFESKEAFVNRHREYVRNILDREKCLIPCGNNVKETISWNIIKKAGSKAIGDIFNTFYQALQQCDLEYIKPVGTSFRILPHKNSYIYMKGISKIIISIDLRKNDNVLVRTKNREYVVEVSIHDMAENYACCEPAGYTKESYIKTFSNPDFDKNTEDIMKEVYRILTLSDVFINKNNKCL